MGWTGTIVNGVLLGGLYGLFGVGLALVFGVTRIVNIMHGEFIALSAFIALGVSSLLPDVHPLVLIMPVVIVSFALGYALQAVLVNRSMRLPDPLAPLLLTFGLSVIVRNLMIEGFASIRAISGRAISVSSASTCSAFRWACCRSLRLCSPLLCS